MTKCTCHGADEAHSQTIVSALERPRYSPGLILEDSDLTAAVTYTRQLNRLLFRNLFGCGVVCGLTVEAKHECDHEVTVTAGLALDGCGDPIEVTRPVTIKLNPDKAVVHGVAQPFWVVLCAGEKLCAPRALVCDADDFDGVTQHTRVRDTATVSISFDEKICGCAAAKRPAEDEPGAVVDNRNAKPAGDECWPDCGCDSACACGCCVVLARVTGRLDPATLKVVWTPQHKEIRRLVRPMLIEAPPVPQTGPVAAAANAAPEPHVLVREVQERLERAIADHPYSTIGRNQALDLVRRVMVVGEPAAADAAAPAPADAAAAPAPNRDGGQ